VNILSYFLFYTFNIFICFQSANPEGAANLAKQLDKDAKPEEGQEAVKSEGVRAPTGDNQIRAPPGGQVNN